MVACDAGGGEVSNARDLIGLDFDHKADLFVSDVFGGVHRVAKFERKHNHWLCIPRGSLSTWDDNKLTRIVIASHKYGIRAEVDNYGMRGVKILLHNRVSREGSMYKRHPTIEQAIGSDAEKAAIVAELERLYDEWKTVRSIDTKNKATLAAAFCSGICSGLSLAIQVVHAGGALPLETNEEGK
jgi:hypothetical protein